MATAIGMGFDVSALLDSIKNAEKALGDLMSKSNQASKSIINAFQQISNQGVGAYVESLEKQMRLYESINAAITTTSGKAKKNYEEMKVGVDSVVNSLNDMIKILQQTNLYKEYKIKLVSDEELAKLKAYQTELSNLFNSEMQYNQRMQAIKEANANKTQRELEEYKKLSSEIERLQKLQSSATYELNKPTSISAYNAAKDALSEIERQLADHKARMVELERKYEAEILVINQQGSIARFEEIRKAERKDLEANEKYKKNKENNLNSLVSSYEREAEAVKRKAESEENAQKRIQALAQQEMEAQRSFVERRVNDANKVAQAEHDANQKAFQESLNIQQQALERFARNEHEKREEIKRTRDAGLEAAQALDKAQARTESLNRAKNYQRTQKYGDTSSQALAAYDRLVSGKGQLSVNNMQDVLSKLEQAQNKINLKTSEGRERYNELEAAIKKVKATIDSVVNAEENAAKKRAKNADEAKKHAEEERKSLEKRLKLLKDIAAEQSKSRSSLYRLTQSSGDTTKQAEAAYNRIYGDKGIQSIKNFNDVLSKLESAQVKINQRTEEGRRKYEEFEKMIQRVKTSINDLSTTDSAKKEALREAQAKTNQQTKDNSARIKSERDAMYKMYEQMFDNIAKKNGQTAEQIIKKNQEELRQRKKYIDEMTNMYARMFDEIARRESQNRASKYGRIQSTGDTTSQALAAYNRLYSDKGIKNINNMNNALQRLRDAQSKLNLNTEEGRKKYSQLGDAIKRVEKDMAKLSQQSENVNKKHSQLLDISGQLQRRLALVFSVSQITGYINKIIQVRGEFELQQKSLQVLIGDLDEANEIWDKTVSLAVKSPFTVKNLVTYTKQLAAYRVESEKLYDTTKMLADVSAGLGVDMQRLILAYGQVKAANFLRGTELRQFTEAGVNMLGELSAYFSEIEGKAVSVGDVFDRISKRRVSFEAVDAVFKRITGEGGVFYQMQEKQSQTLRGMMMNLRDSIDLMMNDIGKSNDGVLKDTVGLIRSIINEWRSLEPILKTAGTTFLAYFSISNLNKIRTAATAMMGAFTAHPVTLITTAVVALVAAIYNARNATSKFNAAILEVEQNAIKSLEESIGLYKKLVDIINDATKTQVERNKAYDQLKQKFTEILPNQLLEIEYVKSLSGNYKEAETAMFNYYNAKAKAQKKDRIEQLYTSELEDTDIPELQKSIKDFIEGDPRIGERAKIKLKSGVVGVVNSLVDDVKSGKINATLEEFNKEIIERLSAYAGFNEQQKEAFGVLLESENSIWTRRRHNIEDIIETLQRYKQSMQSISGLSYGTYEEEKAGEIVNKELENVNKSTELFKQVAGLYENYTQIVEKSGTTIEEQQKAITTSVSQMLEKLKKDAPAYGNYMEGVFKRLEEAAKKGKFAYSEALQTIESEMYAKRGEKEFEGGLGQLAFDQAKIKAEGQGLAIALIDNVQENINKKAEDLEFTAFQKAVTEGAKSIASKFKIDEDLFAQFIPKQNQALSTLQESVKGFIEQREQEIKELETSLQAGMETLSYEVFDQTKQKLDELKKTLPAFKELGKFLGIDEKDTKSGGRSNSLYDERIKVIDDLNKKYRELIATVGHSKAVEEAFASYKDAFAEAYKGISWIPSNVKQMSAAEFVEKVLNFPSEAALVEFLDELAKEPMKVFEKIKVELAKGKYVFDAEVRDIKKKDKEILDAIDDMFGNYEISLELEKLNIPPDLAKRLFGVDAINLGDIRNKIETDLNSARASGGKEELVKDLEQQLKKVEDLEDKALKERLKRYSQFLVKGQSEAVRLKIAELRELAKLEEDYQNGKIRKTDYEAAKIGIKEETQKKIENVEWENFKDTELYIQLFEDLDSVSGRVLNDMKQKLLDMRNSLKNLSPTELKEIMDKINEINKVQTERNPFKLWSVGFVENIKNIHDLRNAQIEYNKELEKQQKIQSKVDYLQINETKLREEISQRNQILEAKKKSSNITEREKREIDSEIESNNGLLDVQEKLLEAEIKRLAVQKGITEAAAKKMVLSQNAADKTKNDLQSVASDAQALSAGLKDWMSTLEMFGVEFDETVSNVLNGYDKMWSGLAEIDVTKPMTILTGALKTTSGFTEVIGSLFGFGNKDKEKEREIQSQIELVNKLGKQYEKLEKQIDEAYSIDQLKGGMDAAKSNIEQQLAAYDNMIAAEEGKKNTDDNRIKEWKEAQEKLQEQIEELRAQAFNEATGGILDDVKSAAREWTDAWFEAFAETGNGLDGLKDHFKENMLEMVKQQASMLITGTYLDDWKKKLEDYVNADDMRLETDEAKEWADYVTKSFPELNAALEAFATSMEQAGVSIKGTGELSGLQRGIQGITEEQSDILASYLNSIRLYVSQNTEHLSKIAASFDTSIENPMLPQLRIIATQTTAIRDLLDNVTINGGAAAFNVRLLNE